MTDSKGNYYKWNPGEGAICKYSPDGDYLVHVFEEGWITGQTEQSRDIESLCFSTDNLKGPHIQVDFEDNVYVKNQKFSSELI